MKRLFVGTFFLSLSILIFEICIIRVFSVIVYANLAFLGVSIALFGIAVGGGIVYFFPKIFANDSSKRQFFNISMAYAGAVFIFVLLLRVVPIDAPNSLAYISLFTIAAIPFIFGSICITALLTYYTAVSGKIYFADLIGAGIGVIVAITAMTFLPLSSVFSLSGLLGVVAAGVFYRCSWRINLTTFVIIGVVSICMYINQSTQIFESKFLYSKIYQKIDTIEFAKSNSFSHISVASQEAEVDRTNVAGYSYPVKTIYIDADASTQVYKIDKSIEETKFLVNELSSLGFQIVPSGNVLIIGPGGGRDVLMALLNNHHVTAVEINPIIIKDLMEDKIAKFSGNLYSDPRVNVKIAEGRSFLRRTSKYYTVISLPLVDTWASTAAGSLALVESNLYTVESMVELLSHLTDNGVLSLVRWELDGTRLITIYLEACKRLGIDHPEKNIVIVRNHNSAWEGQNVYLFKRQAFTQDQLKKIDIFIDANLYIPVVIPDRSTGTDADQYVKTADKQSFIKKYRHDIRAVYDDRPFFFFTTTWQKLWSIEENKIDGGLGLSFMTIIFLTLIVIIIPLVHLRSDMRKKQGERYAVATYLFYFGAIGVGFMLIEMALIQKFVLYLEQPIFSYSVVMATMLISAGIGSLISQRLNVNIFWPVTAIGILLFSLLIFYIFFLSNLIISTIGLALPIKITLAIILITIVGIPMGMFLPVCMRRIGQSKSASLIPYYWMVNGAASVFGSGLAIFVAIFFGFNSALLIGAICYLVALILLNVYQVYHQRRIYDCS